MMERQLNITFMTGLKIRFQYNNTGYVCFISKYKIFSTTATSSRSSIKVAIDVLKTVSFPVKCTLLLLDNFKGFRHDASIPAD